MSVRGGLRSFVVGVAPCLGERKGVGRFRQDAGSSLVPPPIGFEAYARSPGMTTVFGLVANGAVGWEVNFSGMKFFALFVQVAAFQR